MRSAVIGLGPHGQRILTVLKDIPTLEIAAVVDQQPEALAKLDLADTVKRYQSADELWSNGGTDLVCIATNGPSHEALALGAMRAGATHVLVEKPMATEAAACDRMIALADELGVRLSVNQSRRHDPLYRWLRDTIQSGEFGRPRAIWIQRPGIGLGCLATHSFDLAEFLLGLETRKVVAWVDEQRGDNPRGRQFVDPGGTVIMDMGPGIRGIVSQIEDGAGPMSVEVDLTAARIRLDERTGEVEIVHRDLSVKPGPGRPPAYSMISPPNGLSARINMMTMLRGVLDELLSSREPMDCDARFGKRAVEILAAAHLSDRRGNLPVPLPLVTQEERSLWLPVT